MSSVRWEVEGQDWPNREYSRFVRTAMLDWHVQIVGPEGAPVLLLVHGTGAATHSWRDLLPLLAKHYCVIAPDMPGHGFTRGRISGGQSLPGMAKALGELLTKLGYAAPSVIVGHSAGAAIGARLMLDQRWDSALIGITPALMPFPGLAARLFPALARVLFVNPFTAMIFAQMASGRGEVARFLKSSTGSRIDERGVDLYHRLFRTSDHCAGAIGMMANWDLDTLSASLPGLAGRTLLIHGGRDAMIPADSVERAAALIAGAEQKVIPDLGHLAHEEAPDLMADMILAFAAASPAVAA
ncbi:magnesium chelatase accessory protein [Blastomonas natatoria]|uniref:Magnesium chelatase accessory protein n=1 Tax=Blastomonas natatoria TaxID=34015 RepID=A0A2V3UWY5_9SPHN|nr:alpha/beta fold hydrolase BchO [Blastomonas natatoria]PXW73737.1 magnesium chelatase accessory protein [Blastomonas natatoria]